MCTCAGKRTICSGCNGPVSLKREEPSRPGHAKGVSFFAFSSHSQARADRFTKHLPLRKACTTWLRTVAKFENSVSHIGHTLEIVIVVTHSFNPFVPPIERARTSRATLAFVRQCHPLLAFFWSSICTTNFGAFLPQESSRFLATCSTDPSTVRSP